MTPKPVPDGFHTMTLALVLDDARAAIDFYERAFGAEQMGCMAGPDGKVAHAQMKIGNSIFMLADEWPEWGAISPKSLGGTASSQYLYVDDADGLFERAVAAGAEVAQPMTDQFYGDRSGTVIDPHGHKWTIATHVEDVSYEEMNRRFRSFMTQSATG